MAVLSTGCRLLYTADPIAVPGPATNAGRQERGETCRLWPGSLACSTEGRVQLLPSRCGGTRRGSRCNPSPGSGDGGLVLADYQLYFGVIVVAMALSLLRAVRVSVHQQGWAAIAVAIWCSAPRSSCGSSFTRDLDDPPYPSWAEPAVSRLLPCELRRRRPLFRARARGVPAGIWLDGLTAALAAGAIGAPVLVEVVLDTTSGSLSTVATRHGLPAGRCLPAGTGRRRLLGHPLAPRRRLAPDRCRAHMWRRSATASTSSRRRAEPT